MILLLVVLIAPIIRCIETTMVTIRSHLTPGLDEWDELSLKGFVCIIADYFPASKWLSRIEMDKGKFGVIRS